MPSPKSPSASPSTRAFELSTAQLVWRKNQIDMGKNTPEYKTYRKLVSKDARKSLLQPPDVYDDISKRNFQGRIVAWRKALHAFTMTAPSPPKRSPSSPTASPKTPRNSPSTPRW